MKNTISNTLSRGNEVIKIIPAAIAFSLLMTLSACRDVPKEVKHYGLGETEKVNDTLTLIHHPDYIIEENSANHFRDPQAFPDKEASIERKVIILPAGEAYLRFDPTDHHTYIGSHQKTDTTEADLGQGVVDIKWPRAK